MAGCNEIIPGGPDGPPFLRVFCNEKDRETIPAFLLAMKGGYWIMEGETKAE